MKSLQDFRVLMEEEKTDYTKFDTLVRAGLANKAQLARLHRILDKMTDERPQFNNADREIMRNLFNRMVDLIANNKQIFQKTRQAVRESFDDEKNFLENTELVEAKAGDDFDPPFVLMLKRRAIRMYPDGTRVALYYNRQLNKYFSVPYGNTVDPVIQSEEVEQIEEAVMDTLHKIVASKSAQSVKFASGHSRKVDHYTASAITQVHNAVNDENKKKLADMVHKSPAHFEKVAKFAFSKAK